MKILLVHAAYVQRGGEDVSLEVDAQLLRDRGHEVTVRQWQNSKLSRSEAATRQVWSSTIYEEVVNQIHSVQPDVVHFVNTTWALGPAAICAAHDARTPVVASLNNQRLTFGWRDLFCAPYNGRMTQSLALVAGNSLHRKWTWINKVDRFIAVSRYIQGQLADVGFPLDRISVKGDTVYPVPEFHHDGGPRFLYVGRICAEKGVPILLEAWQSLAMQYETKSDGIHVEPALSLDIVGRLPEQPLQQVGVTYHGALPHKAVLEMMAKARAVIVPSVWPEPSGRVVREAMACGTPVIASAIGGLPEARPAVQVYPGDAQKLAQAVRMVSLWSPSEVVRQRLVARAQFEQDASPDKQVELLLDAYQRAIEHRAARGIRYSPGKLDDPATRAHLARFDEGKP